MKRILMTIMAVGVAVTFSAPAFAGEEKKDAKDEKKVPKMVQMINADEKKDEKKGGHAGTFEEKKDEKKKDEKGK